MSGEKDSPKVNYSNVVYITCPKPHKRACEVV